MDLSQYKRVCICFREITQYAEIEDGANKYFSAAVYWNSSSSVGIVTRRAIVSKNGIEFFNGFDSGKIADSSMNPMKIYGIR